MKAKNTTSYASWNRRLHLVNARRAQYGGDDGPLDIKKPAEAGFTCWPQLSGLFQLQGFDLVSVLHFLADNLFSLF